MGGFVFKFLSCQDQSQSASQGVKTEEKEAFNSNFLNNLINSRKMDQKYLTECLT